MNQENNFHRLLASVLCEAPMVNAQNQLGQIPSNLDDETGMQDQGLNQDPGLPIPAQQQVEEEPQEEEYPEELDDANYMEQPMEVAPTIDEIIKREEKTKLFNNFSELKDLIENAIENFKEKLSFDLLEKKQYESYLLVANNLSDLIRKITDYQLNSFIAREYEENLYTYMLIRGEFLTNIKFLRKALKLNSILNGDNPNTKKENNLN